DKAINAYQETAKISKDGKPYVTLGELYSDKEQWSNSIKAFDQAFKKGDLEDDEGRAYLRKGIAQLNLGQCDSALSTFNTASKYKDYKDHSKQWRGMVSQRRDRNKCK
ncbi:MAG: hypothetical protein OEY19_04020, partial [Gammaproteobacteria bacterium]|nr:hypothetical protein [Gammaproteobacteria bacterium]